jgi:hypothetical protein
LLAGATRIWGTDRIKAFDGDYPLVEFPDTAEDRSQFACPEFEILHALLQRQEVEVKSLRAALQSKKEAIQSKKEAISKLREAISKLREKAIQHPRRWGHIVATRLCLVRERSARSSAAAVNEVPP